MKADYIKEIVKSLEKLPYDCVLIDGKWGIGKSYAIDEVIKDKKDKKDIYKISMFGLQDSQQIYHEVLFQLLFHNNKARKVGKGISKALNFGEALKEVRQVKNIVDSAIKERELFIMASKKFDRCHIIVIDDLERISEHVKLNEVMGIIEELKQCNYVKVIVVANLEAFNNETDKQLLKKYEEKVIDRVYHITERPEEIDYRSLGMIEADFLKSFLEKHDVKNFRTLQKAQNFFEDVRRFCHINNDDFINEIRLICFATVVESIDRLYYREVDAEERNKGILVVQNELETRIANYLSNTRSGRGLRTLILKYYKNQSVLTEEMLNVEFELFLKAGEKPNFYKSDVEIKAFLIDCSNSIEQEENIFNLNRLVDSYVLWSDIVGYDTKAQLRVYKEKLHDLLWDKVNAGDEDILNYGSDSFIIESEKVKKICNDEIKHTIQRTIGMYVDYLSHTTNNKTAFHYSYKLRKYYEQGSWKMCIQDMADRLYTPNSFPIDLMTEEKRSTCFNIMYVLYHCDNEKFQKYCDKLISQNDKMAAHRMQYVLAEIKKVN